MKTINCSDGGSDVLSGGSGDVDYIIGGGFDDVIDGNSGMDLVFGDHALIKMHELSHRLDYATTIDPDCSVGADIIRLGEGDDIVSQQNDSTQIGTILLKLTECYEIFSYFYTCRHLVDL